MFFKNTIVRGGAIVLQGERVAWIKAIQRNLEGKMSEILMSFEFWNSKILIYLNIQLVSKSAIYRFVKSIMEVGFEDLL